MSATPLRTIGRWSTDWKPPSRPSEAGPKLSMGHWDSLSSYGWTTQTEMRCSVQQLATSTESSARFMIAGKTDKAEALLRLWQSYMDVSTLIYTR